MVLDLVRVVCSSVGSCYILLYFCLNLTFAFVELAWGIWSNSLGLMTDSFHMFFDCTGLLIGLIAAGIVRAQWRANLKFTYGYGRVDAIAGMVNAVCLLFVSFLLIFEAVKRINDVPKVNPQNLLYVSMGGLCVNFIGIIIIYSNTPQRRVRRRTLSAGYQDISDENRNIMLGMLMHVISDALGSIGVIISSVIIEQKGWMIADPVCSIVIAVLILFGVMPLLRDTLDILMQRAPRELDGVLPLYMEKIAQLPNVLKVKEPSFWTLHSQYYVATLRLEVHHSISRSDKDALIWAVKEMLAERGFKKTTVEVEDVMDMGSQPNV